jgi:hypothetical protein
MASSIRFGYRHPLLVSLIRTGVGVWLLILASGILGHTPGGALWTVFLLAAAALNFFLAFARPRMIAARRHSDTRHA